MAGQFQPGTRQLSPSTGCRSIGNGPTCTNKLAGLNGRKANSRTKLVRNQLPHTQRRSSRPPNPPIGGPRPTLGAQVSLKLLFGYVTIFSSADLFTTDLNCRKKLACDIISECYVILSRRILNIQLT